MSKIRTAGHVNREIQNKLKPYVPITDVMLNNSSWFERLYAIKFHGNPVKIEPLTNSTIPNIKENIKNEFTVFLLKNAKIRVVNP